MGKPFDVNLQPLDPLHRRLITIGLLAPLSRRGPVTFAAPLPRFPVRAVLLSLSALVLLTMQSCPHLLSQLTNCVSPLFVTEFAPQSRCQPQDLRLLSSIRRSLADTLGFVITAFSQR